MGMINYLFDWTRFGISRGDLLLEVGSGNRPFVRSDVLCDMFLDDNSERAARHPVLADRPLVCGDAETLPFQDHVFDFVLSSHLLEHLIYPEHFLEEAMRVSRRGYFVTPSDFCERILPQPIHLWLVTIDADGTLVLEQKTRANESQVPGLLHEAWLTDRRFRRFFASRPDLFETRFQWEGRFSYRVVRYEERPSWLKKAVAQPHSQAPETPGQRGWSSPSLPEARLAVAARSALSRMVRWAHSSTTRVDPYPLLACPVCRSQVELQDKNQLSCVGCRRTYAVRPDGIPMLLAEKAE